MSDLRKRTNLKKVFLFAAVMSSEGLCLGVQGCRAL